MQIENKKAVTMAYTLTDNSGNILDTADANEPFIYLHGFGNIIPGLEQALDGKQKDDQVTVNLAPADAYGEHAEQLIQEVPKEMFGDLDDNDMFVGAQFHAETNQGVQVVTVAAINEETITIDGNHPMAGQSLNFDVTILDVRDATAEEIAHGHIHAHGDSCGGH